MNIIRLTLCVSCLSPLLISAGVLRAQQPDVSSLFESMGGIEQFKRSMFWPPERNFPSASFFWSNHQAFRGMATALTEDQKKKVSNLEASWHATAFSDAKREFGEDVWKKVTLHPKTLTDAERIQVLNYAEKILTEHEQELSKIVNAEQIARATQLQIQRFEATAFLKEPIAQALNLDQKQIAQIQQIVKSKPLPAAPFSGSFHGGTIKGQEAQQKAALAAHAARVKKWHVDFKRISKQRLELALKVLTPMQKVVYEQLTGKLTWEFAP